MHVEAKYLNEAFPQWSAVHPPSACPKSLRELDRYMDKASRNDPWGREYLMTCGDGRLYIASLGPDGKANTADDIWSNQ